MRGLIIALFWALCLAGCASVPFREVEPAPLKTVDSRQLLEEHRARLPDRFQLLNSVVFSRPMATFTAIGYLDVNRPENSFRVVCLNPLGVQLFELSGDGAGMTTHSVLPALMQFGDLPTAVGTDIRRMFFDLAPAADAQVWRWPRRISFWQASGPGRMQFVFAGATHDLVEKNYYEGGEAVWSVSYYEYLEDNAKRYPRGIVLENYRHGYTLTIRHKELHF